MSWYQDSWSKGGGTSAIMNRFYTKFSKKITTEFDLVLKEPTLFDNDTMLSNVYEWALRFPGNGFSDLFSKEELLNILISKQNKGSVLI